MSGLTANLSFCCNPNIYVCALTVSTTLNQFRRENSIFFYFSLTVSTLNFRPAGKKNGAARFLFALWGIRNYNLFKHHTNTCVGWEDERNIKEQQQQNKKSRGGKKSQAPDSRLRSVRGRGAVAPFNLVTALALLPCRTDLLSRWQQQKLLMVP